MDALLEVLFPGISHFWRCNMSATPLVLEASAQVATFHHRTHSSWTRAKLSREINTPTGDRFRMPLERNRGPQSQTRALARSRASCLI